VGSTERAVEAVGGGTTSIQGGGTTISPGGMAVAGGGKPALVLARPTSVVGGACVKNETLGRHPYRSADVSADNYFGGADALTLQMK
jgi:hypothetical protein